MDQKPTAPQTVVILGASNNPERYSYMAFKMLQDHGHNTILISPKIKEIEKHPVLSELKNVQEKVDTLTMYVGPERSSALQDQILKLNPKRVIFNPGSENEALKSALKNQGIEVLDACTLVLLRTEQFNEHF